MSEPVGRPRSRVLQMNEATSDYLEYIPLPARQQLGLFDEKVDVDARSGNGLVDRVEMVDAPGTDYAQPNPYTGGGGTLGVTYHLESTPPPSEPAGAPGSESYNRNVRATPGAEESQTVRIPTAAGGSVIAYQREGEPITTQREQPGRDQRISDITGANDVSRPAEPTDLPVVDSSNAVTSTSSSDAETGPDSSDDASAASAPAQDEDEVPEGSMQVVLGWVGDDKDRAQRALDAERERPTPRNTLIAQLEDKLA